MNLLLKIRITKSYFNFPSLLFVASGDKSCAVVEDIGDCFAFDMSLIQPKDDRITKFCDYLIENYVDEDSETVFGV